MLQISAIHVGEARIVRWLLFAFTFRSLPHRMLALVLLRAG